MFLQCSAILQSNIRLTNHEICWTKRSKMVCSNITKIPEKVNTAMYFSGRPCAVQLYIVHNFDILM